MNDQKVVRPMSPTPPANITYYGGSPSSDKFPLQRCEGDCDSDNHCADGLYCQQRVADEPVSGCLGIDSSYNTDDFCVDPADEVDAAFLALPTGGCK